MPSRAEASTVGLTASAVLALRAAGADGSRPRRAPTSSPTRPAFKPTESPQLAAMAEAVTGGASPSLVAALKALRQPTGLIGPTLNSTYWGVLALVQAGRGCAAGDGERDRGRAAPGRRLRVGGAASLRTTTTPSAAVEALAAAGVRVGRWRAGSRTSVHAATPTAATSSPPGGRSNAQSTAWAIQAFLAAGAKVPAGAFAFLARLTARRRKRPLLRAVRDDAALGLRAGAARARATSVPAPLERHDLVHSPPEALGAVRDQEHGTVAGGVRRRPRSAAAAVGWSR